MGNALLPFAFFVSFIYYQKKLRILMLFIFILAILCAGNFAFLLAILLFSGLYYIYIKRWTLKKIVINGFLGIILLSVIAVPSYTYFAKIIEKKAISSNPTRIDQGNVLINNMAEGLSTILFGQGLGNKINVKTQWRDYSHSIYYELQALYIMNQVGIIFFSFFILLNLLLSIFFIKYKVLLIAYASYIFYALFNPYFFDTNHIVVIIVLLSLRKVLDDKNIYDTRCI
jgi:hypothetical protein